MSLRELDVALVHFAAEGDVKNVRKRINAGANPDSVSDVRTPALSWAVSAGHIEVVKVLLSAGARANLADMGGMNALHCGGRVGNLEATKLLLSAQALINAQTYIDGFTALHFACNAGHVDMVELLMEHGALHLASFRGRGVIPVMVAFGNGHEDCGAAIVARAVNERGGLYSSVDERLEKLCDWSSSEDITRVLGDASPPLSFHHLVAAGDVDGVRAKLVEGCTPDDRDCSGMTALAVCCAAGCAEVLEVLLAASANLTLTDGSGYTALHAGCFFDSHKCVQQMIAAHASVNVAGIDGCMPLHLRLARPTTDVIAFMGGGEEGLPRSQICLTVEQLLTARANVDAALLSKSTALHMSCFSGYANVVELLLSHGAEINATCKQYSGSKLETPVELVC